VFIGLETKGEVNAGEGKEVIFVEGKIDVVCLI
jgi:hypothetical protein